MRLTTILMLCLALTSQLSLTTAHAEEPVAEVFDIDGNANIDALTDGLLLIRYLFGFRDVPLISNAIGTGASRTTSTEIERYLDANLSLFDIDDNTQTDALTDGLLSIRYLFGFRGAPLISNALAGDANRTTAEEIEAHISPITLIVSTSSDNNGSISPTSKTVIQGLNATFILTTATNYEIDTVTGCDGLISDNEYTTGAISEACTVIATFKTITHIVSTSSGDNGSFSTSSVIVNQGSSTTFTLTPATNHEIDTITGCGGSLSGNQYITGEISEACTVSATFKAITHIVSSNSGDNGSFSASSVIVNQGSSTAFTLTPATNYEIDTVTGCDGSLSNNEYTTGEISEACSVNATFKAITHIVSTSSGGNGSFIPSSVIVNQGSDTIVTIIPSADYQIDTVSGCDGSLSGNEYTTGTISAACTVSARFKIRPKVSDIVFDGDLFKKCILATGKVYVDELTVINCNIRGVSSVSGIEELTALTSLSMFGAIMTSIDLSKNTELTSLSLVDGQLASIDVTKNTALTILSLHVNQLETIDVSQNAALTHLNLHVNQLTEIDVTKNIALTTLTLGDNQLTTIDLSQNIALTTFSLTHSPLVAIDLSKNTALTHLYLNSNQIKTIDVTQNTALIQLYLYTNQLLTINLTQNIVLGQLQLQGNQITAIDVTQNTVLTHLFGYSNQLTTIDVSKNTALTQLLLHSNQLTSINVTQNTELTRLLLTGNQLTSIDLTNNPNIGRGNSFIQLDSDVICVGDVCP